MLTPDMDRSSMGLNLFFCLNPNLGEKNAPSGRALAGKGPLTKPKVTSSQVAS